jgi:hypothetical protein
LDRARAVELLALLRWGRAERLPQDHHYLLPSGEHAEGFIRLADGIREPRDAEVIASWLAPDIRDGVGVVADTGTITPIVTALSACVRGIGWRLGEIRVLGSYPQTHTAVRAAVGRAARGATGVLGLVSVNSSGRLLVQLLDAVEGLAVEPATVHVFVDNNPIETRDDRPVTWLPLTGEPLIRRETGPACTLCRSTDRAPLVAIDPVSYSPEWPGATVKIVPSLGHATENNKFWTECSRVSAVGLQRQRRPGLVPLRGTNELGVRIDVPSLLQEPAIRADLKTRLTRSVNGYFAAHATGASLRPEVILVPEHELRDHPDLLEETLAALSPEVLAFPGSEAFRGFPLGGRELEEDTQTAIRAARQVLVFATGTVTGATLQQALFAAQMAAPRVGDFEVHGMVAHARPGDGRAWQSLVNSYAYRLYVGWRTPLPFRSPLTDERETLSHQVDPDQLATAAKDFWHARVRFCATREAEDPGGLFWGSKPGEQISPQSIFGERLSAAVVYAAVGAAMEEGRIEASKNELRRVFHLPVMLRSYYDAHILAAFLRWLRPHERWWGDDPDDGAVVVSEVVQRSDVPEQRRVLLAELLLAAGQGKLAPSAATEARKLAENELEMVREDDYQRGALELGIAIVKAGAAR